MINKNRKQIRHIYKSIALSSIIISILNISILSYLVGLIWVGPRCTTCFFHFNIDYRLGRADIEDRIIREPYYKLLEMYEKHPNWLFTVECQAEMIFKIFNNSKYDYIRNLTLDLINCGQMELLCALQFDELFYAYPADVFELNLMYANLTLQNFGLLNKRSNCILFQEGQFAYGLATLMKSPYSSNIDTVLVSAQQIKGFQNPNINHHDYPVYILYNSEYNNFIKILQYDYLPKWEGGYYHSWNYLYDGEIAFEDEDAEEEFIVSLEKLKIYEQELELLESRGNIFMTCSEWVRHCERIGAVGMLNYYIPECNWANTKYNSSFTWAAKNSGSTDDGEMLANNYRCRQIIYATKIVYQKYKSFIVFENQSVIENNFYQAEKLWLQATCSDATGVGPDSIERYTAELNVLKAQLLCSQILQMLANYVAELNVTQIQVDLLKNLVWNSKIDFISLTNPLNTNLTLDDLPLNVFLSSTGQNIYKLKPDVNVQLVRYNSSDDSLNNVILDLYQVDITFQGSHDWENNSLSEISIEFQFKEKERNFQNIRYSPTLLENTTKYICRDNYYHDPLYIFLLLSNGLLFIPNTPSSSFGTALVKNITQRHTSWLWEENIVKIIETHGIHLDVHHQFYIMNNISVDQALGFANRINIYPLWIVSNNVSLIQGNEVYSIYEQMENRLS
jgi:hypothetical protein